MHQRIPKICGRKQEEWPKKGYYVQAEVIKLRWVTQGRDLSLLTCHSGQESLSLISSSHVERADSAGRGLRAGILLNTATQQEAGTANRPELAIERKFIFQS